MLARRGGPPVSSRRYVLWLTVPAKTHCLGDSTRRMPYGGRNRSVVLLMNALIRATSEWLRLSNSDNSMTQTPRVCIAASLLPRSASSSVKNSPASVLSAVDLRIPCGPSRMRQQSALAPGRKILATAEISQRDPTARAYSVSPTPRYEESQVSRRCTPSHLRP